MDFRDRHIVVTGGAGALGAAVVEALLGAGAICHVPCFDEAEAQRFRLRDRKGVRLTVTGSLADEAAVGRLYQGIAPLWASIHIAGGFAAAPLRETTAAMLRQQIDMPVPAAASSIFRPAPASNGAAAPAWWLTPQARRQSRR